MLSPPVIKNFYTVTLFLVTHYAQWRTLGGGRGGGAKGGASPHPPIIFTEALVLKSESARKFLFQVVEPLLII